MGTAIAQNSSEADRLLGRGAAAWRHLLDRHRGRLRRMLALRLDHRLKGLIDPSDVIQETYLEATMQMDEYFRQRTRLRPAINRS
jgi:RNA polymerase sigma-70 factor (ECF subfamily)